MQQLHQRGGTYVVGLCGGYQMLGESIHDPDGVESPIKQLDGLGLIPMITTMEQKKTTVLSCGEAEFAGERVTVEGYEIHMGQSVYDKNDAPFIQMEERVEGYCHEEWPFGIADEEFSQRKPDKGLITKKEVRILSIAQLQLHTKSIVWDIGTCTGLWT